MNAWSFFNTCCLVFWCISHYCLHRYVANEMELYQQYFPKESLEPVEQVSATDIKARAVWLVSSECILPGSGICLLLAVGEWAAEGSRCVNGDGYSKGEYLGVWRFGSTLKGTLFAGWLGDIQRHDVHRPPLAWNKSMSSESGFSGSSTFVPDYWSNLILARHLYGSLFTYLSSHWLSMTAKNDQVLNHDTSKEEVMTCRNPHSEDWSCS